MLVHGRREPIGGWARDAKAAPRWGRWYRPVAFGLTVALLAAAAVVFVFLWRGIDARGEIGYDAHLFAMFGQRFVETGEAYFPVQFGAPYLVQGTVNVYPPLALYLFVPLAYVPLILWWAIPIAVFAWHLARYRPKPWAWPVLALMLAYPPTVSGLIYGSSTMWSAAFLCIAFRYPLAAALIAFKPVDILVWPLFVRRKAFWIGLAIMALAALPFGELWFDWFAAITNTVGSSPLRNITGWPLLLLPVVAWFRPAARGSPTTGTQWQWWQRG
jgi:hypothetical protein